MRNHLPFIPLVVLMTMLMSLPSAYGYDLGDGFHSIKISATGENRIVPRPRPRPTAILMRAAVPEEPHDTDAKAFAEGLAAYDSQQYGKAFQIWSRLAYLGNADAQCQIGLMHKVGINAVRDDALALKWYQKALAGKMQYATDACKEGARLAVRDSKQLAVKPQNLFVCETALSDEKNDWTHNPARRWAVNSAIQRNLSVSDCRGILNQTRSAYGSLGPVTIASLAAESLNPVNSTAKGRLSTTGATSVQGTGKGNFTPEAVGTQNIWQQSEAQSSNILKVIEAPLSFEGGKAAYKDGHKLFYDRLSAANSSKPNIAIATNTKEGNRELCSRTLNENRDGWLSGTQYYSFQEAMRRKLSVDDCRVALGLIPTVNLSDRPIKIQAKASVKQQPNYERILGSAAAANTEWKAAFRDGLAAYNNGLTERAYKIWSRLAEAGDADAQCHLGLMFQQGIYVIRNNRAADNWFRMALDRGLKQGTGCKFAAKKAAGIAKPASLQDLDEKTTSPSKLSESRRIALVIGNNDYKEIPALDNPANDARDMAAALKSLGFEVITALDANRFEMENKLADFAKSARTADVAVAFYAGHGMQHEGINYLIPVDGQLTDETDLRRFIKLRSVIEDLQSTKGVRILIVDACRDNEALTRFAGSLPKTRSMAYGKGLADEGAEGVLVAYATQPGKVAVDEVGGKNSPFTAAILKHIRTANTDVRVMFTRVRKDVLEATDYKQRPEVSDSLSGEFSFKSFSPPPVNQTQAANAPTESGYVVQLAAYRSEQEALGQFQQLRARHGNIIGNLPPAVQQTNLGAIGTFYRLGMGPVSSKRAATELCNKLTAAGERDCLVRRR